MKKKLNVKGFSVAAMVIIFFGCTSILVDDMPSAGYSRSDDPFKSADSGIVLGSAIPAIPTNDPNVLNIQGISITYAGFEVRDTTVQAGDTLPLQAGIKPLMHISEPIVWTSSDTSVFTVETSNPEGTDAKVTIVGSGTVNMAVLTVAIGGVQAECIIRVMK